MADTVEVRTKREFRYNGVARKVGGRPFGMHKSAAERAERRGQVEILDEPEDDGEDTEGEEEGGEQTRADLLKELKVAYDGEDHNALGRALGQLSEEPVPATKEERMRAAERFLDG